jgi:hypothetical protein
MSSGQFQDIEDPESFFTQMRVVITTPAASENVTSFAQALVTLRSWADTVLTMDVTDPASDVSTSVSGTGATLIGFIYNRRSL